MEGVWARQTLELKKCVIGTLRLNLLILSYKITDIRLNDFKGFRSPATHRASRVLSELVLRLG
jgi:hypothetical protein